MMSQQSNFILSAPHGTTMLRYSHIIVGLTAIIKTERLLIEKKAELLFFLQAQSSKFW